MESEAAKEAAKWSYQKIFWALEDSIEMVSRALDIRSRENDGHTKRLADLTAKLAEALDVGEEERAHMRRGALLHDIGTIFIPESTLLKPGQLTEQEWKTIRLHPVHAKGLIWRTMSDIPPSVRTETKI